MSFCTQINYLEPEKAPGLKTHQATQLSLPFLKSTFYLRMEGTFVMYPTQPSVAQSPWSIVPCIPRKHRCSHTYLLTNFIPYSTGMSWAHRALPLHTPPWSKPLSRVHFRILPELCICYVLSLEIIYLLYFPFTGELFSVHHHAF